MGGRLHDRMHKFKRQNTKRINPAPLIQSRSRHGRFSSSDKPAETEVMVMLRNAKMMSQIGGHAK